MLNKFLRFAERHFKLLLWFQFLILLIFVVSNGVIMHNDSAGYLDMDLNRLPLYPIFVQLFFYENFQFTFLIIQAFFIFISIYHLIFTLKKHIALNPFYYLILAAILLFPCYHTQKIANSMLSEAIAYPLYLLCLTILCKSFFTENSRYLWRLLPLAILLMLSRSQFIFIVPVTLILVVYISWAKRNYKKQIVLFLCILSLPIISSLLDKSYHKIENGHFVTTPWTGIHLISPAFFVANENDIIIYKTEEERNFYSLIFNKLKERHLNINYLEDPEVDRTFFYQTKFTRIANYTLFDYGKTLFDKDLTEDERLIALDTRTKSMVLPLILKNLKEWTSLNLKNFLRGFGDPILAVLYGFLLLFSYYSCFKYQDNYSKILALMSTCAILNMAVVALGIHTIKRFTFYNDWVIYLALFIFFAVFLKLKRQDKNEIIKAV